MKREEELWLPWVLLPFASFELYLDVLPVVLIFFENLASSSAIIFIVFFVFLIAPLLDFKDIGID